MISLIAFFVGTVSGAWLAVLGSSADAPKKPQEGFRPLIFEVRFARSQYVVYNDNPYGLGGTKNWRVAPVRCPTVTSGQGSVYIAYGQDMNTLDTMPYVPCIYLPSRQTPP